MHYQKPINELVVPVGLQILGAVTVRAVDATTGGVIAERKGQNTILNQYFNSVLQSRKTLIGTSDNPGAVRTYDSALYQCAIGTDDTPTVAGDTGVKGTTLSTMKGADVSCSGYGDHPIAAKRKFVFPAGVGTGEIGEAVLFEAPQNVGYDDNRYGYEGLAVARKTFTPKLNKTANVQLEVEWTFTVQRAQDQVTGTILKGQRDGVTAIDWVATINNRQLFFWCFGYYGSYSKTYYMGPQGWDTTYLRCKVGSSNTATDLSNDIHNTVKGTELFPLTRNLTLGSVSPYLPDSFYRDVEYGFDITEANGSIGEILPGYLNQSIQMSSSNVFSLTRITFNPPLNKPEPSSSGWRLYITVRYQIGPVTS